MPGCHKWLTRYSVPSRQKKKTTNNKKYSVMEQKDIDIYEILKGMPDGTPLYTPMYGNVEFTSVEADKEKSRAIWTENENGAYSFDKHGKWIKGGEVLLFPSKEMRDWSKFFKKGDVLVNEDRQVYVIFEKFEDDAYTKFRGKHYLWEETYNTEVFQMETSVFEKANDDDAQTYINTIEELLGGKLNRETLEIEKPAKPAFKIGKLYVFNEEDEDGKVTVIGKFIGKGAGDGTLVFGKQYEIETEYFIANETFCLNISLHDELREATADEAKLFNKHYSSWEEKEKEAMAQPAFKPFDKVLVRNGDNYKWLPAFFVRDRGVGFEWRYKVLPIHSGKVADFSSCIPFEGNEHLAFTSDPF